MTPATSVVYAPDDAAPHLVERTRRALVALGAAPVVARDARALRCAAARPGALFLVRAGAFGFELPPELPESATARPVVGFGVVRPAPPPTREQVPLVAAAEALLARTGGDLDRAPEALAAGVLPFATLLLSEAARRRALDAAAASGSPLDALAGCRVVHVAALDAAFAEALRVLEVVTSLQIGGAERVARDLAKLLPRAGVDARLVALGAPTRARWAPLPHELDLGAAGGAPARRLAALRLAARRWGADVVHSHLFGPDLFELLAEAGLPHVATIHNARQGWPEATLGHGPERAALLVGCARAVEHELARAGARARLRAVPNGIDTDRAGGAGARGAPTAHDHEAGATALAACGVPEGAARILIVANPRRQKRLDRVPAVARALAARVGRRVAVIWAGGGADRHAEASEATAAFERGMAAAGPACTLHRLGAEAELLPLYAVADAMLSTSDWEGLSLVHLEAIAAGLPLVATDVGGTGEIESTGGFVRVVPPDAPPEAFVDALVGALEAGRGGALPARFGAPAMVRGYARLLAHGARPRRAAPGGLVLVTNNFSPGGAQSSARRLLCELARREVAVTAITLEERPRPEAERTPGTQALAAAGVPVLHAPVGDAARAASFVADAVAARGAGGLLLWNAIAEHKALLAETLFDVPVVDVSPGEMYFDSLARYFGRPRDDLALRDARAYGARLAGCVVKWRGEAERARDVLGCPVSVIPNGVVSAASPRVARATAEVVFGTAVRVHPHKRLDLLIDAFRVAHAALGRRGVRATLEILGAPDAGCEGHVAELTARAEGAPVRFLGFHDDPRARLAALDVFVLVAEPAGCPNASLEALATGVPVIATDCGGMAEQLEAGAGVLVGRFDAEALAAAMSELGASEPRRAALGLAGWRRAREVFSLERMAERYLALFDGEVQVGTKKVGLPAES